MTRDAKDFERALRTTWPFMRMRLEPWRTPKDSAFPVIGNPFIRSVRDGNVYVRPYNFDADDRHTERCLTPAETTDNRYVLYEHSEGQDIKICDVVGQYGEYMPLDIRTREAIGLRCRDYKDIKDECEETVALAKKKRREKAMETLQELHDDVFNSIRGNAQSRAYRNTDLLSQAQVSASKLGDFKVIDKRKVSPECRQSQP